LSFLENVPDFVLEFAALAAVTLASAKRANKELTGRLNLFEPVVFTRRLLQCSDLAHDCRYR
jgi:hypothetical protein